MTEEKDTESSGRIRRFLNDLFGAIRCIFIVLLVLLLIAGLYFKVPWKVTALIAIILATLTIVPKRARKWIWPTFAIIIITIVVWVFLPEENGDWRPYTFDEELAAMEAKRAVPDDQNAATIYNKLIETYDVNDFEPEFMDDELDDLTMSEPWSSDNYPEMAEWLEGRQDTIETLIAACKRERCYFPSKPDPIGLGKTMDRLSPMRHWAKLLIRSGNNDIGDGEIEEALEKYICVLQIAEHLYQQPSLIERLSAIAIEALGRSQVTRFVVVGDATEERLRLLDKNLGQSKHDWVSDWSSTIEYEKLLLKSMLAMFYEVNSKGGIRYARDPMESIRQEYKGFGHESPTRIYWYKKLAKSHAILAWFYMPHSPQEVAKIIDASFKKCQAMEQPDFDWEKGPIKTKSRLKFNYRYMTEMISAMLEEPYHKIHDMYLRNIPGNRTIQIIIALRRYKNEHGRWPDSLEDVKSLALGELFIDPINNDSYVYRLTEDGFTLYSKGKNNIDENGERNTNKQDGSRTDDLLIWPPKNRKSEQKTTEESS